MSSLAFAGSVVQKELNKASRPIGDPMLSLQEHEGPVDNSFTALDSFISKDNKAFGIMTYDSDSTSTILITVLIVVLIIVAIILCCCCCACCAGAAAIRKAEEDRKIKEEKDKKDEENKAKMMDPPMEGAM